MYENRPIEPANKKDLIEIDAIVDGEEKIKENFKIIRHSETIDRKSRQEEVGYRQHVFVMWRSWSWLGLLELAQND